LSLGAAAAQLFGVTIRLVDNDYERPFRVSPKIPR